MNQLINSNNQEEIKYEISKEVLDFESMKKELISILNDITKILEKEIFGSINNNLGNDIIKIYINDFLNKYVYLDKNLLNQDIYYSFFTKNQISGDNIDLNIDRVLKSINERYKRNFSHDKAFTNFYTELYSLTRVNKNVLGYIILKSLEYQINNSIENNFYFYAKYLQNSYLFEGTGFEKILSDFFMKYYHFIPYDGLRRILHTENGEKLIEKLLTTEKDESKKLDIFLFILQYEKEKYLKYIDAIRIECIKLIGKKTLKSDKKPIELELLMKLYSFYNYYNDEKIDYQIDVEKAFVDYYEFYTQYDFDAYNIENFGIHNLTLPQIYVRRSVKGRIKTIIENILEEREIREKTGKKSLLPHEKRYLMMRLTSGLSDQMASDLDYSAEILEKEDLEDYVELRKSKPEKYSENAKYIRNYRENFKLIQSPLVIRQRMYNMIINLLLSGDYESQKWPSIGEELSEKRRIAFEKKREKEALDEELNQKPKEKNGFILVNQDGDDNLPF